MTKEKDTSVNYFKIFLIILAAIAAGFIFIILLLIIALAIIKPFGVNVLKAPALILGPSSETESTYDHPLFSTEQEVMLESIGIDTTSIPTEITAAQQQCAVDALGKDRVTQIIDGSAPTVSDLLKAQNCF
ncbi:MAG: hypothetical protein ABH826_00130 [Patescibacteria group bacterium]